MKRLSIFSNFAIDAAIIRGLVKTGIGHYPYTLYDWLREVYDNEDVSNYELAKRWDAINKPSNQNTK